MLNRFTMCIAGLFLLLVSCGRKQAPLFVPGPDERIVVHQVQVKHPDTKEPLPGLLHQLVDAQGAPLAYAMEVDSVPPADVHCESKPLPIRLYWDALGTYQRYELPEGVVLARQGEVAFTAKDHEKLNGILRDLGSPLREHTRKTITGNTDVVTAATLMALRSAVVKGAGYTCYHLWHRANGDIVKVIRETTHASCNEALLIGFLGHNDPIYVRFALEHLALHHIGTPAAISATMKTVETEDLNIILPLYTYLKAVILEPAQLYDHLAMVYERSRTKDRVQLLDILAEDKAVPASFYERVCRTLPQVNTYYELQLLLLQVEMTGYHSPAINRLVVPLLNHENFFIARRAFWYLEKQELDAEVQAKMETFKKANTDRL